MSLEESLQDGDGAIIVGIDNASSNPDTKDLLSIYCDDVKRFDNRVSLAAAWNFGIRRKPEADITVITNDDILYTKGWLDNLIIAMELNPTVGIMQPYNTVGAMPVDFPENYTLRDSVGDVPKDNFVGCCFGIRQDALQKMLELEAKQGIEPYPGMFDERLFPFGAEDQDYYWRMRRVGYQIKTDFGSYIHHYTGQTMTKLYSPEEFEEIKKRTAVFMHEKHRQIEANG